jgi:hypothetical protein
MPANYARNRLPRGMIYRAPKKSKDISLDASINEGLKKMGLQSFEDFHLEIRHAAEPITAAKRIVGTALHFGTSSEDNFRIGSMMIGGAILVVVVCTAIHLWDRDEDEDVKYQRARRTPDSASGSSSAIEKRSDTVRRRGGGRSRSKSSPRGKKNQATPDTSAAAAAAADSASATATAALTTLVGGVSSVVDGVSSAVGAGGKKLKDGTRLKIQPEGVQSQNPMTGSMGMSSSDAGASKNAGTSSLLPI